MMHTIIDDVVRAANMMQKSERVLLTYRDFGTRSDQGPVRGFTIVFFSIQPEKRPIAFEDALGRRYRLPFGLCKNWEVSQSI